MGWLAACAVTVTAFASVLTADELQKRFSFGALPLGSRYRMIRCRLVRST